MGNREDPAGPNQAARLHEGGHGMHPGDQPLKGVHKQRPHQTWLERVPARVQALEVLQSRGARRAVADRLQGALPGSGEENLVPRDDR